MKKILFSTLFILLLFSLAGCGGSGSQNLPSEPGATETPTPLITATYNPTPDPSAVPTPTPISSSKIYVGTDGGASFTNKTDNIF